MVHYQKKNSIYTQKNNYSSEEMEYQVKGSLEAANKNPHDCPESSSEQAYNKVLPHLIQK